MSPKNVTLLIGQSTQLICDARGTDLVYQWMKDSTEISGATSDKLNIVNTQESNEGVYMCRASNKGGMVVSYPATITVYGELM